MKKQIGVLLLLGLFNVPLLKAQNFTNIYAVNDVQYGFSLKTQVMLNDNRTHKKRLKLPTMRVCLQAGAAVLLKATHQFRILPAYNLEVLVFHNGIGSSDSVSTNADITSSFTSTLGVLNAKEKTNEQRLQNSISPLYYFSNNALPSLRNPFSNSVTIGFNYIIPTSKFKFGQRVAVFGMKVRDFQTLYYNDGGTVMRLVGDRKDRNHTGGWLFSYGFRQNTLLNLLELTYTKYTGYNLNTFEVLSALSFGYNDYKNERQSDFNRSKWSLTGSFAQNKFSANIDANNFTFLDVQHFIHKMVFDPYHVVERPPSVSIGGSYNYFNLNYLK